jgi:hypothetical protein
MAAGGDIGDIGNTSGCDGHCCILLHDTPLGRRAIDNNEEMKI